MFYIYMIQNRLNLKVYIGLTDNYRRRWKEHCSDKQLVVQKAIRKHGKENFTFSVIGRYETLEEACQAEMLEISEFGSFGNGYNMTRGGEGMKGYKPSAETRKKQSDAKKGKPTHNKGKKGVSAETSKRMSESRKNSEAARIAIKALHSKSRKFSEEQISRIGEMFFSGKFTYDTLAEHLGCSKTCAYMAVQRAAKGEE